MRKQFEHKGSNQFKGMMNKARVEYAKTSKIPVWCPNTIWNQLLAYWARSDFKDVSEQNKRNRASRKGGVLHTSRRVSHSERAIQAVSLYYDDFKVDFLVHVY
jgi:hypothetical protein